MGGGTTEEPVPSGTPPHPRTMSSKSALLKIGEFARQAGTNLRTLRYYEELGLLQPADRSEGGFRYYAPEQLARMEAIKRLQRLGLSLREIQDMMQCSSEAEQVALANALDGALQRQGEILEERMAEMQRDLEQIAAARQRLEHCRTCDETLCATDCDPCPKDQVPLPGVLKALL